MDQESRGELRIYLGAAPGVGKTYAMLGEARRRLDRGCDVVAALVETHGRAVTEAALDGIEVVPPTEIPYRGTVGRELDLDAVLARRPDLVLVDELAHTNTPGSRNTKRWQDVEVLLDAGLDVVSTLNVQHLESLNDVVQQITGVVQRETVPDNVVRAAAQVELVDITPEALRSRMSHGNIYSAEKIDAALDNYFRRGNLTALRELALLWIADQVDAALVKYRTDEHITDTWEARERVVVAVTGGPESETLVRRASRVASRSSAELMVVHVVRGDGLAGVSAPQMGAVRTLATAVGASMHSVVGDDVPTTLLEFARGVNATQLVIGTSRRSRFARIVDEGIGSSVVQNSGTIDVHMVTHGETGFRRRRLRVHADSRARRMLSWVAAVAVPCVAAAVLAIVDPQFDSSGESALFFMVVLCVALLGGVAPAALSALIAGFLLNFFFTAPRHSFAVAEPENFVVTVVLLIVAVAVAVLVDTASRRAREARRASREAELLTLFAGSVLRGADLDALLERVRETYGQRSVSLIEVSTGDTVGSVGDVPAPTVEHADTRIDAPAGDFTMVLAGARTRARDRRVLTAVANQAAGLVRQARLTEEASRASALAEADVLRRALLSAVSHDLRTPLAAVKAASSSLRSTDIEFSPEDTAELLATIDESADQLTALVGNLLDSSRLQAGVVRPTLQPVYVEDAVHRSLVGSSAPVGRVHIDVGDVEVLADVGLLERVLANLVDNSARHAPDSDIRISATRAGERASITVSDGGPGIAEGSESTMFDAFQRLGDRNNAVGVGLGLSVVKGFAEAMGGSVVASGTAGGGLTMTVELGAVIR
ncbi:sensor histidine kinase KdpD [Rhodococcus sp. B10]|uniref:sensor histidine kinase n=1 Tax=Rhodococcus sp. B10 TaxID=2695876 RepID=UPI0014313092|nr:sensor histidine kinase KdpD [Rhodococcus sp. B10]NIL76406.1 Sensor protein KdpD [Rhodococcus sp. B10]